MRRSTSLRFSDGSIPEDLDYHPKDLARIDTTFHGQTGELVGEFRWDFDPVTQYSIGQMMGTERGITRTDWVNTDQVEWNEGAMLIDAVVGDARPASQPTSPARSRRTRFFGPIVRPFVGPGYWAPMREGDYAQVNVPSWADGGSPQHTGAFDVFEPVRRPFAAHRRVRSTASCARRCRGSPPPCSTSPRARATSAS